MSFPLKALLIEDSENDVFLVLNELKRGGYEVSSLCVETPDSMTRALKEGQWDIIVSDFSLPHFSGLEALEILKESQLDIPFILVSGTIGEEKAVEVLKKGVNNYVMKDQL